MSPAESDTGEVPARQISAGELQNVNPNDEINLRDLFELLRSGRWTIAAIVVAVTLLGLFYSIVASPVYEANGLVQVEEDSKQSSITSQLNDISSLLMGTPVETEAEIQILKSNLVLTEGVHKMNLLVTEIPRYFPIIGAKIWRLNMNVDKPVHVPGIFRKYAWGGDRIAVTTFEVPEELQDHGFVLEKTLDGFKLLDREDQTVLRGFVGSLASVDRADGHYEILVRELAAEPGTQFRLVRNALPTILNELALKVDVAEQGKQSGVIKITAHGSTALYVREVVNDMENAYLKQNVERRSADAQSSLDFLSKQLPDLKRHVETSQAKLKSYQTAHGDVDVVGETAALLQESVDLETRRLDLQEQRALALTTLTAEHPTVKALDDQLATLDMKRNTLLTKTKNLPTTQQDILNLTRDVTVDSQLYTDMASSMQQLEVAKAGTVGNVRIIDRALKPLKPIRPKLSLILPLSTMVGLLFGIGTVFAQRALLKGVDDPAEIEARYGLSCYALIPYSVEQQRLSQSMERNRDNKQKESYLLASIDPTNVAIEALRSLRTSLHFAMIDSPNNIILFTGPSPGLGKSFVSINLAAVLAVSGKKVVLIDADLRKGQLNRYFSFDPVPGLADYIAGDVKYDDLIHRSIVAGFDVITRGTHPPNPSELLLHERFADLLKLLSANYDYVLIDSPPILPVTDSAIIGRLAGLTLLVLKAAEHPVSEIDESLKRLRAAGVMVKGVVFNQMGAKAGSYGYESYGYSYYSYRA